MIWVIVREIVKKNEGQEIRGTICGTSRKKAAVERGEVEQS